jgi:hypothetical protein
MGQIVTAVCKCKDYSEDNLVNAEAKNYFTLMTPGWMFIHAIMLFVTASFWIGWIGGSWLLKGTVYVCTECENEIDKTNLRIGKTKKVVVQTSEVKEITVSSNKKSEEVSASVEKRLEDILNLKEKGLINDDEYQIKKKEIIKDF